MGLDEEDDLGLNDDLGVFTRAGGVWRSRLLNGFFLGVLEGGGGSSRLLPMAPKTAMGFRESAILAALALALAFARRAALPQPRSGGSARRYASVSIT